MDMPYSEKTKIALRQWLFITILWTLAGLPIAAYDHLLTAFYYVDRTPDYRLSGSILANIGGGLVAGIFALPIYLFFLKDHSRRLPFWASLILNTLFFVLSIGLISLLITIAYQSIATRQAPWFADIWPRIWRVFSVAFLLRIELIWFFIASLTVFMIQVGEKYGQGGLVDVLLGRYHHPKQDYRIFMFLDVKSSTTIAERLGNIHYFNFINDFFADITDAIVNSKGKIYQYVGDEVVVSWSLKAGREGNNCIRCFFEAEQAIAERGTYYRKRYGFYPEFKAGYHFGRATIGEIGLIKKDIVFSGDVLNTTARIQSLCNEYQAKILLSHDLLEQLPLGDVYFHKSVGHIQLRGKTEKIEIYKLTDAPFP